MPANPQSLRITEAYRRGLAALVRDGKRRARAAWRDLDYAEINASYPPIAAAMTTVISRAQREAVRLTGGYLGAFLTSELGGAAAPAISSAGYVGRSFGGLPLEESLDSPRAAMLIAIGEGKPDPKALGLSILLANVDLDIKAAARAALHDAIAADDRLEGWQRAVKGTCGACSGSLEREPGGDVMLVHPNCECVAEPIVGKKAPNSYRAGERAPMTPVQEAALKSYLDPNRYEQIQNYWRGLDYSPTTTQSWTKAQVEEQAKALAEAISNGRSWPGEQMFRVTELPDEIVRGLGAGEQYVMTEEGFFSTAGGGEFISAQDALDSAYKIAAQTHKDQERLVALVIDPDHRAAMSSWDQAETLAIAADERIFGPGTQFRLVRKLPSRTVSGPGNIERSVDVYEVQVI